MGRRSLPVWLEVEGPPSFPEPREADAEGLLAVGGDLSPERLTLAYERGIFPWYGASDPPLWWSPDPRAIIEGADLRISRSLRRVLRHGPFTVTRDRAFTEVMLGCAEREEGTWIFPEMIAAYTRLFARGRARSFEVWQDGELVGGLYGVHLGGFFAGESMFHRRTDASKVALVMAVTTLFDAGLELFDVQFLTPHLASLGARELSRARYLERLASAVAKSVTLSGPTELACAV
ncbi:MAG: leucyl/phenylalanyl-tRNA--protein transferase [Sorangiineae bacterium]|nr:leucyl/phenylalanyl-tRNA--protein transferase [Polyangiaceae bacterium]MEB2323475.1 leucyl/phenylalanyl-tRNA--protein transferase [Sorangiineae bacterium]